MSLFRPSPPPPSQPREAGWTPPARTRQAGDRTLAHRLDEAVPYHRQNGVKSSAVVDRNPRGCLFKVGRGFFDLEGYWCVPRADRQVRVTRGAPKKVMKLLTKAQRHELARVRLNARRHGLR